MSTASTLIQPKTTAAGRDALCQAKAQSFLAELVGTRPAQLVWDGTHHLQGHAHLAGRELVVIAPRDEAHRPLVVTAEDWDEIRRASHEQRRALLATCPIRNRARLVEILSN